MSKMKTTMLVDNEGHWELSDEAKELLPDFMALAFFLVIAVIFHLTGAWDG